MKISYLDPSPPLKTAAGTDLAQLLESYVFCARAEGKSPRTIDIRITSVLSLLEFLRANNLSTSAVDIGPGELRRFILHLQSVPAYLKHPFSRPRRHGLSGHTINGYLRSLRAFWSWLVSEEIIESSPFARVHIPRAPRKVIPAFTEAQLQALLGAMPRTTGAGFRDWTMVITMIDTGIRASELVGLTLDAVNLEDRVLRVAGKGDRERMVPIGATVQQAIWRYIQHYRPQPRRTACTNVFLNRDGEPMTVNCLENRVRDYGSKACIEGVRCSPHTFRHTFAINYLRNGGDVFSLQRILGHSSLEIVRIYVNMSQVDVQACHRRCSPADNMDLTRRGLTNRLAHSGSGLPPGSTRIAAAVASSGNQRNVDRDAAHLSARLERGHTGGNGPAWRWPA